MFTDLFSWLQSDSGESWSGSQVMWKGTECLPITPSHLHEIKSQLSSIVHDDYDDDDDNNKLKHKCNLIKLIHYLQKTENKSKILTWYILFIWNEIPLSYLLM